MTGPACAVCHRTTTPGTHICPGHLADLRAHLAELPRLVRLLEAEFVAASGSPARGRIGSTGRAHAPVPVDLRVLTLLGPGRVDPAGPDDDGTVPILALLDEWAGHLAYTYSSASRDRHGTQHTQPCEAAVPRSGYTVTGWCAWLTAYLPYAAGLPAVGDLHHQLHRLTDRLYDLTHAVPHSHPQTAPCPHCQAFGLVAVDGRDGITCTVCGHHLTTTAYAHHARAHLDAHQPATT
ncbi:hypothetical protein ABZX40_36450 [Streptomyces sp. NPDC004610]|uniref:hypothetical protein n=1 Tax=unclassified Streptomyces TaxID=2593676 RepID=UPI0033BBD53F